MGGGGESELVKQTARLLRRRVRYDIEELLGHLFDQWGGPLGLAVEYKKLHDTSQSPMVRQKILMMIQSLLHAHTLYSLKQPPDYSQMDDARLEEEIRGLFPGAADAEGEDEGDEDITRPWGGGPGPAGGAAP